MAGSQLLPSLLLLTVVLLLRPGANFSASSGTPRGVTGETSASTSKSWTSSSSSHSSLSLIETSTGPASLPRSEADSTTLHSPSHSETTPTTQPSSTSSGLLSTSPQPEIIPHPSSGSPSSDLTPTSHSSPLNSTALTLHWNPTSSSPRTEPPSMSLATTDSTSVASGPRPDGAGAPELHRNPGLVVAVCLLVSILLIGSVVVAMRCCHWGVSEFQKLDEVSMGTVSQRSSFAHCPPERSL